MFDDALRRLKRATAATQVPISLYLDDDRYFDRRCPAEDCGAAFKVLFDDWETKVTEEQVWCAICGETAAATEWNTPEQWEQIKAHALQYMSDQVHKAFSGARKPTTRAGMISMTWSYKPGARPIVVMAEAAPLMTQRSTCEACGCAYASVGAAFFCPACGHNSARSTFSGALATVRALMDLAERMPGVVEDRDAAADAARHLIEDSLVRVWFSFQRFAEATYKTEHPTAEPPRRNAFQNLAESDRLWGAVIGKTYADMLTAEEHRDLVRLVQARHVAHQDGFVDADYVARSGDRRFKVGQRLVVTVADTRRLADLAEKLSAAI